MKKGGYHAFGNHLFLLKLKIENGEWKMES